MKSMAIERGKACSRSEEKTDFNRAFGGEGCVTNFTDKTWKVTKGALVIEKGEKVGTLYLCNGISNYDNALTSTG